MIVTDIQLFSSGLVGGLNDVLNGLPDFFVVHLFDRGFKRYLLHGVLSFFDHLRAISLQTGGRVKFYCPSDAGDDYYDVVGQSFPPPPDPPGHVRGKLLYEVQANSTRVFTTMNRAPAEWAFGRVWQHQITACRSSAPQQYLLPYGKPPTPQIPLLSVIQYVHSALMYEVATPHREVYSLPPGVTYAGVARTALHRLPKMNWLDPLRMVGPFIRRDNFSRPTQVQLRQGRQGRMGNVRLVDALNSVATEFPQITRDELHELTGGGYIASLTRNYLASYRRNEVATLQYLNLANYQHSLEAPINQMEAWLVDQNVAPNNWYGLWNSNLPNTDPWVNVRVLTIPRVPSRYQAAVGHTVVLAYIPTSLPVPAGAAIRTGFHSPSLQRLQMYCCGPRNQSGCKVGARTATCCSHVATAVCAAGILAYNPVYNNPNKRLAYLDPGTALPMAYTREVLANTIG